MAAQAWQLRQRRPPLGGFGNPAARCPSPPQMRLRAAQAGQQAAQTAPGTVVHHHVAVAPPVVAVTAPPPSQFMTESERMASHWASYGK